MNSTETTRGAARRLRWIVALAALALATPAAAAPRSTPAGRSSPAAPPATSSGVARPVTAAPPAPAAPTAPAAPAADAPIDPGWRFGPALGLEFGIGDAKYDAVKLRIDAQREVRRLSADTTISFLGAFSMAHASGSESLTVVVDPFLGRVASGTIEWDANVFELVPTARLTYAATPGISFVADGGLGAVYTAARAHVPPVLAGWQSADPVKDGVGGVVRIAGGLVLTPSPGFRIAIEGVGFHLRFGNGPGSGFDLVASISHRL